MTFIELLMVILGTTNLFLGLSNAVQGKKSKCVWNAIAFGACLYYLMERGILPV